VGTTVIRDALIVTMNASDDIVRGDVKIEGNIITAVGGRQEADGGRVIEAGGRVLLPGFVQTHVHLCQTLFRGCADDLELMDWLRKRIWPLEAAHDEESVYWSAMLGAGELIRSGTTTILDMETVRHADSAFEAIRECGIRAVSGKAMMDHGDGVPPALMEKTEESLEESVRLLEKWHGAAGGRIRYAFSPRFVVSCSEALLTAVRDLAEAYGVLVHTHAAENRGEIALVEAERGMRNVVYLDAIGLARPNLVLAHAIWLDEEEKRIIRERGVKVSHCPGSNLKLASGIADVPGLAGAGVPVGFGADGAPCNNQLDMFQEMRLASFIQKVRLGPTAMRAREVLRMATIGGAEVLGLASEIGSIEPGKRADLQMLDLEDFHVYPSCGADPYSRIVYAATRGDVDTVMIDGVIVMEGREMRTIDKARVLREADRCLERLLERI